MVESRRGIELASKESKLRSATRSESRSLRVAESATAQAKIRQDAPGKILEARSGRSLQEVRGVLASIGKRVNDDAVFAR
jgi:hypothetical protein